MNTKRCGRAQDNKTVKLLQSMGYPSYTISAASLGVFDTISWNNNGIVFVQNKRNDMPPRLELLHLMRCKVPKNAYRFIFLWKTRAREPEIWQVYDTEIIAIEYEECKQKIESLGKLQTVITENFDLNILNNATNN